jgi:rare lipoprotein A (peptidoglycan hydrolase)
VSRRGCTVSPEKGGALRNQSTGGRRLGVAAVLCGVLFGLPLLLLHNQTAHASRVRTASPVLHARHKVSPATHLDGVDLKSHLVSYQHAAGSTTTTTVAPTTTTTAAPATTTTVPPAPATTTTTAPPPPPTTTTTTTRPAPTSSESGQATWYAEAPDGYCASPTLPFGTVMTVTNNATGASTSCTVDDREDAGYPRVVDMSPAGFEQIAPLGQGVAEVTISW